MPLSLMYRQETPPGLPLFGLVAEKRDTTGTTFLTDQSGR